MSKEDFLKYFGAEVESEKRVIAEVPKETALALQVTDILARFGIPRHIKGFAFLREAIVLSVNDRSQIDCITKSLYPAIANKFGTLPNRAERAMRHAIEVGCRNNPEEMELYFSRQMNVLSDKPTNGEFIATIADQIRLRGKHETV
jgi:two-component system response regulator (stage 0 sporulation protein A)